MRSLAHPRFRAPVAPHERWPGAPRLGRRGLLAGALGVVAFRAASTSRAASYDAEAPRLSPSAPRLALEAGRSVIELALPARAYVSMGIFGPRHALLGCSFNGSELARRLAAHSPLDEDGLLPRIVSLETDEEPEPMSVVIDLADPASLVLTWADRDALGAPTPRGLERGLELPRPLVGLPAPRSRRDGYMLAVPGRYLFGRLDVVRDLQRAFAATQKRYRGDPIAVSDLSQWDGRRPKSDLSEPRHISHDGGLDVDLALPASDAIPSTVRDHCRGVLLEPDRYGCAPGTARGVDHARLAMLLGTLVDLEPGRITKIFLDDVYRRELIRAAPALFEKRFIEAPALAALGEDGLLVASPWHTDHVHVRFAGEKARTPSW